MPRRILVEIVLVAVQDCRGTYGVSGLTGLLLGPPSGTPWGVPLGVSFGAASLEASEHPRNIQNPTAVTSEILILYLFGSVADPLATESQREHVLERIKNAVIPHVSDPRASSRFR